MHAAAAAPSPRPPQRVVATSTSEAPPRDQAPGVDDSTLGDVTSGRPSTESLGAELDDALGQAAPPRAGSERGLSSKASAAKAAPKKLPSAVNAEGSGPLQVHAAVAFPLSSPPEKARPADPGRRVTAGASAVRPKGLHPEGGDAAAKAAARAVRRGQSRGLLRPKDPAVPRPPPSPFRRPRDAVACKTEMEGSASDEGTSAREAPDLAENAPDAADRPPQVHAAEASWRLTSTARDASGPEVASFGVPLSHGTPADWGVLPCGPHVPREWLILCNATWGREWFRSRDEASEAFRALWRTPIARDVRREVMDRWVAPVARIPHDLLPLEWQRIITFRHWSLDPKMYDREARPQGLTRSELSDAWIEVAFAQFIEGNEGRWKTFFPEADSGIVSRIHYQARSNVLLLATAKFLGLVRDEESSPLYTGSGTLVLCLGELAWRALEGKRGDCQLCKDLLFLTLAAHVFGVVERRRAYLIRETLARPTKRRRGCPSRARRNWFLANS